MVASREKKSRFYTRELAQVSYPYRSLFEQYQYSYIYTVLHFTTGPYSGSRKEPDFFFQVNDHILPTLVVECGWSESKGEFTTT